MSNFFSENSTILGLLFAFISMGLGFFAIHPYRLSKIKAREEDFEKHFRKVRDFIKNNRSHLQFKAREHYQKSGAAILNIQNYLITGDGWMPETPVPLEDISLEQIDDIVPVLCSKSNDNNQNIPGLRYKAPFHGNYENYAEAIKAIDKPAIFEGNLQYRLLKINRNKLSYSRDKYSYFDKINFGGYFDYEMADNLLFDKNLKYKTKIIQHLTEPHQYIILTGVNTLTLINAPDGLRFLVHSRGSNETATSMNTMHVIPAGEFQPSCRATVSWSEDFDLWKNILRESAEELLLLEEYPHINKDPFNYKAEPYLTIENERAHGNIKAYYLGIGLDPNTLQGEVLTCVVYKEEAFLKIFHRDKTKGVLRTNPEGNLIHEGDGQWGFRATERRINEIIEGDSLSACKALLIILQRNIDFFSNCFSETISRG
jgi:hypothetical protein